ncbi:MAG: carboxylating nicotinate-nucleotide diphosphorylase [Planctomycetes bacterium]|nr:carboxylating nicotinate-nucleotide diphosphorylase [Planctomycetota bacterium]NOG54361.1 carboxylating nicotinate-nucleotide diphosphorylase [Planctomycetota bacterium]
MGDSSIPISHSDLNNLTLPDLYSSLVPEAHLRTLLELARAEDLEDSGDITTQLTCSTSSSARPGSASAHVIAAAPGVAAGLAILPTLLDVFQADLTHTDSITDGTSVVPGTVLTTLTGPLPDILTVERTLLNFLGRLSGIASQTARFVTRTQGCNAVVLDTRKTTPGHRGLEKYAVRCGGGHCHRIGLYDAILIKDNHVAGLPDGLKNSSLVDTLAEARAQYHPTFIEVEVDSLEQLDTVLTWPAGTVDIVLLDNMTTAQLVEAVADRDARNPSLLLEASGGVTIDTIAAIAATGVDRISIGSLTHSAPTLDIRMDLVH